MQKFKLERIPDVTLSGFGVKREDKWGYELYTPILWKLKCECGHEINVGTSKINPSREQCFSCNLGLHFNNPFLIWLKVSLFNS